MDINNLPERQVFTVSQLNRRTRQLLETHLPLIWVEGELSNLACPSSGHWYFTLKDDNAQVRGAMFRNRNGLVRFRPQNGMQVMVRCRVSLYEGRGEFQLIVEHMEEAGLGALQRRFEELKAKLMAEGLFAAEHKKPVPTLPKRIGVITSPTGAAIQDILNILRRRFPSIPVSIYPTGVQGREAIEQVATAIEIANRDNRCDVLIVGRGGGSMEDLWAFNEERVARAIYHSNIPIVSAVGHEVDFTISDLVADLRAPTPSAAAELLSPDGAELLATFAGYQQLLADTVKRQIQALRQKLEHLQRRQRHPGERLREQQQHLDHLEIRLQAAQAKKLQQCQSNLKELSARLSRFHPEVKIADYKQRTNYLSERLHNAIRLQLKNRQTVLVSVVQMLNAVSPLKTLERGYSITLTDQGKVIHSTKEVAIGQTVTTRLSDGTLQCTVDSVER